MWRKLIPAATQSSGRKSLKPAAALSASGLLSLNAAAAAALGEPEKVVVEVDVEKRAFRLAPATPADRGAWTLSGGGNTTYRIRLAAHAKEFEECGMPGEYVVTRQAGCVVLTRS